MNNEEKILPEQKTSVENTNPEKKLSKGALIGIIAGAVALVAVVVVLLVVLLGGKNKCDAHVDADDDYLCDKCGEHFDDGDELPEQPVSTAKNVTFIVKLDNGTPLEGVKLYIVRGETSIALTTGADGKAELSLEKLAYSIEYDYDTLPEYCTPDLFGVKISDDKNEVVITVTNNTPDGSFEKPFPVLESETAITIGANAELNYVYRGASVKYLTVDSDALTVNYGGSSYSLDAENLPLFIEPEIGKATGFSIKNTTGEEISFTLYLTAPKGSSENPIEISDSGATVTVNCESVIYYSWTATKDGVLTLTCDNERNNISVTRILENDVPEVAQTNGESTVTMEVKAGDVITIGVSALEAERDHENQEFDIEISFSLSIN